jgi:glycosyltransferase involved in cell wall biosynthesis
VAILHLLPSFDYTAAGRQVSLIVPLLGNDAHVAALGRDGPFAEPLRSAGVTVHALGGRGRFDVAALWRLRQLIADLRPDVVHAWRLPALRAAGLLHAVGRPPFRLIVSEPLRGGHVNALDRRLLRSADAVISSYAAEADSLLRLGILADRIHELPPVVAPPTGEAPPLNLPLPAGSKVVMCVGSLTPPHGFREAIWAADLLRYMVDDLRLVIVGPGDRTALSRFARGLNPVGGRIFFLPPRLNTAALLGRADVVWVPSRSPCGRQVVLEAKAAGRPVVASALPALASLIAESQTGMLTPPGDPRELAKKTRSLFQEPELAERIGSAARDTVVRFTPASVAAALRLLYTRTEVDLAVSRPGP